MASTQRSMSALAGQPHFHHGGGKVRGRQSGRRHQGPDQGTAREGSSSQNGCSQVGGEGGGVEFEERGERT